MPVRHSDNSLLMPGIAWVLLSAVVGLSYARAHAFTGVRVVAALAVAGVVVALAFAILSVAGGLLIIWVVESRHRSQRRKDGGKGET